MSAAATGAGISAERSEAILVRLADREVSARVLRTIAKRTHDERFARAAGAVIGKHGGRPARDDSAALRRMGALLDAGTARTIEQAASYVARTLPGEQSSAAATARLMRKHRAARGAAARAIAKNI
jgi:hypothetical protein